MRESNGSLFIFKERKRLHKCNLNGILENVKTLSKGVIMKRNTQSNNEKVLRYSLRKYKLGLASVTIGAVFLSFAAVQGVKAEEVSTPSSSVQVEAADSSLFASNQVTETPTSSVTTETETGPKSTNAGLIQKEDTVRLDTGKLDAVAENTSNNVTTDRAVISTLNNASEYPIAEGTTFSRVTKSRQGFTWSLDLG